MYGNYTDPEQMKDVFKAIDDESVENIIFYINDGADPDLRDKTGRSLLIHAMINRKYHAAETLLQMGANPDGIIDVTGHSALHYAAGDDSAHMIGVLLSYKADLNLQDHFKLTPLHMAVAKGRLEAVQALTEAGADLTAQDSKQERPVDLAILLAAHVVESIAKPFIPIVAYLRVQMENKDLEVLAREERQARLDRDLAVLKSRDPNRFKLKI